MNLSALIKTSRPRFWLYTLGPLIVGVTAAGPALTQASVATLVALAVLVAYLAWPANLLIYGINDIFDYETDVLNAKKHGYENIVPPDNRKKVARVIALSNLPLLALLMALLPEPAAVGLIVFLVLGIFYSAPPLRFKTKPFLDSASNVLYALPGFIAWSLLTNTSPLATPTGRLALLGGGLWCAAMHAFSAAPDIEADTAAGLPTVATVLGARGTILFCLVLYLGAALILGLVTLPAAGYLGAIYAALMGRAYAAANDPAKLMKIYKSFPTVNALVGFALFVIITLIQTSAR